jgi:hypothetical protein
MGLGWAITGTLVDRLVGTDRNVFAAVGIVLGAVGGIYVVYLRHGRGNDGDG